MSTKLMAQEAADILGYHVVHFRRLLREGKVNGERFNRVWMIDHQEVERIQALQGPGRRLPKSGPGKTKDRILKR